MRSASPRPGPLLPCAALLLLWAGAASAQSSGEQAEPRRFEAERQGVFGGERVRYRVVVAENFLADAQGKPGASVISTSYLRIDSGADEPRPVVFAFNGGPGSSSVWMHMGLLGPRVVDLGDELQPITTPPFRLADNPHSILDTADVVIFDPPGTGFSRVLPGIDTAQFYGVRQDAEALVDFIEDWIREHGRWNSPRFLMGESYGTIRAAVTAQLLAGGPLNTGDLEALTLNGVILLGLVLDRTKGESSWAAALPTQAATAWFHGRIDGGPTLEQHVAAAHEFAAGPLLRALFAGARLDESERAGIARRYAQLTGLSEDFVLENDFRISRDAFAGELLRERDLEVGRYDSRYTLPSASSGGDPVTDDPAMAQYVPAYMAGINTYMRDELGVTIDERYELIAFRDVNFRWDYGFGPGVMPNRDFSDDLATAMRRNLSLRLFAGSGYYDLVTPLGAAEHTVAHLGPVQDRIVVRNYESGHAPYMGPESRGALARDLRAFIREAIR